MIDMSIFHYHSIFVTETKETHVYALCFLRSARPTGSPRQRLAENSYSYEWGEFITLNSCFTLTGTSNIHFYLDYSSLH